MIQQPGLTRRTPIKKASLDSLRQGTTRTWSAQGGAASIGNLPLANVGLAAGAFVTLLLILGIVGILAIQLVYAGKIFPGVRALGVPVGGMTREEARAALQDRVAGLSSRSFTIGFKELSWTVAGQHLGVRPEADPVVDEAFKLGREGGLIARLGFQVQLALHGDQHEVHAPGYDPVAMGAFMQALAGAVNRPTSDAKLSLTPEGTVEFIEGQAGRQLQVEATQARLEEALARPDLTNVELIVQEDQPKVGSAELAVAKAQADMLVSAPIKLHFEELDWELSPKQLASMAAVKGTAGVTLERAAVKQWANTLAKEVEQEPQSARFNWERGTLSLLRPSKDGRALETDKLVDIVMAKALTQDRQIVLPVAVTKPEFSQEDSDKLKIAGSIEVASTSYAGASPPKRHNIALATERLNGVVIPPGKMFSFNKEVGSTSLDAGYQLGWGIANAGGTNVKTVPSAAGGICQVATTLFHTIFWGGYQLEERNYHLYWITGYASKGVEGMDATVDEEANLDLRFINNTDDYLLIQSWTEGSKVWFGLYGQKPDWTVKVKPGERTDVQKASQDKIEEDEPTLPLGQRLAVEGAMDGFKVENVRTVTKAGEEPRVLRLASNYRSSRNVVLVGTGGRPAGQPRVESNRAVTSGGGSSTVTPSSSGTPAPKPTASGNGNAATGPTPATKPSTSTSTQPATKPSTTTAPAPAPATKPVISPLFPSGGTAAPKPGSTTGR